MTETTTTSTGMLDKVRKLLAKAEAEGVTPPEAEALTAKAAELMARYGIDRARLGALRPETDKPSNRIIDIANPWAQVRLHLLAGIARAMRCQCVQLHTKEAGARLHIFGYESDLERTDILYTSLLLQMASALTHDQLLWAASPPDRRGSRRAWNRSYLLGWVTAVIGRVQAAEARARETAGAEDRASGGPSTELVLADRSVKVRKELDDAYPVTRKTRITYSGRGYGAGHAAGQRADIGAGRLGPSARPITR
jgi:hypothetical protein